MLSVQWPSWPHWVGGYPLGAQIPNLHVPGYPTQGLSVGGFPILGGEGGFALELQSGLIDSSAGGGGMVPPLPQDGFGDLGGGGTPSVWKAKMEVMYPSLKSSGPSYTWWASFWTPFWQMDT
jgi:hypothetical protein